MTQTPIEWRFTVEPQDAKAMRALLDRFAAEGLTYSERSRFVWWRRFTLTAPADVMPYARELVQDLKRDLWFDRVTPHREHHTGRPQSEVAVGVGREANP